MPHSSRLCWPSLLPLRLNVSIHNSALNTRRRFILDRALRQVTSSTLHQDNLICLQKLLLPRPLRRRRPRLSLRMELIRVCDSRDATTRFGESIVADSFADMIKDAIIQVSSSRDFSFIRGGRWTSARPGRKLLRIEGRDPVAQWTAVSDSLSNKLIVIAIIRHSS